MSFAKNLVKKIGRDSIKTLDEVDLDREFCDTGSYILNALISSSLFGGVPNNRITAFAGPSATGKTYLVMDILKQFRMNNPDSIIYFADTEFAVYEELFEDRGLDIGNVIFSRPKTVEEFRSEMYQVLETYMAEETKPKMIGVLDSLANLSSIKEVNDMSKEENKVDMTRAKMIKGAFRVLTQILGAANVPLLVTNHVYDSQNPFAPGQIMAGGTGLRYNATSVIYLNKKKDKENVGEGTILSARTDKSRLSKENHTVDIRLSFETGIDKYYGLLDLGERHAVIPRVGNRYEFPDGSKYFRKEIENDPEKFFDAEVLSRLEVAAKKEFAYGQE